MPAAGGFRPDRLAPVSGPQEMVQRHFVEQLVEPLRGTPVLDAPVPQMVDQLSGFLKHDVVQVIDVPKIPLDSTPLRRPQMVEQLVEVPVPESVLVACGTDFAGREWGQYAGAGGIFWCLGSTLYTRRERPFGFTASPGWYTNTGQG